MRGFLARTLRPTRTSFSRGVATRRAHTNYGGGYMGSGHRFDKPSEVEKPRVLVTGAVGQIGTALVTKLRQLYGADNIVGSDIKAPPAGSVPIDGPFIYLDVLSQDNLARVILEYRVDWVIHLASLLSAVGEQNPQLAMKLNTRGIENVLEVARLNQLKVFAPSTIAVFGPSTPRDKTPDLTVMRPTTMYGLTKIYLEHLGEYYNRKFGVDFRSVRYPGIISSESPPGGGTTDYAVEIYHKALQQGSYKCFLRSDTEMPMMYMPDCLDAVIQLMNADNSKLTQRVYNIHGLSFTPEQVAATIKQRIPKFEITYQPDFRQAIADSWPRSLDDTPARKDWGWNPKTDKIDVMTEDMLSALAPQYMANMQIGHIELKSK